jgi:hypothetical protein
MPARIVPRSIEIAMRSSEEYRVGCTECDWFPDGIVDEVGARRLAYDHNVGSHDGAGVDIVADDFARLTRDQLQFLRKQRRVSTFGCVGAVVGLIAQQFGGSSILGIITFTGLVALLFLNANFYGRWTVRIEQEEARLAVLHEEG